MYHSQWIVKTGPARHKGVKKKKQKNVGGGGKRKLWKSMLFITCLGKGCYLALWVLEIQTKATQLATSKMWCHQKVDVKSTFPVSDE